MAKPSHEGVAGLLAPGKDLDMTPERAGGRRSAGVFLDEPVFVYSSSSGLAEYLRDPRRAITEDGVVCLMCGRCFRHSPTHTSAARPDVRPVQAALRLQLAPGPDGCRGAPDTRGQRQPPGPGRPHPPPSDLRRHRAAHGRGAATRTLSRSCSRVASASRRRTPLSRGMVEGASRRPRRAHPDARREARGKLRAGERATRTHAVETRRPVARPCRRNTKEKQS